MYTERDAENIRELRERERERERESVLVLIHNKLPFPSHNMIISKRRPLLPSALTITRNALTVNS
jgi:hypothetical protein